MDDDFPDFGEWDTEGLGRAFDNERARAIFAELARNYGQEADRETFDRVVAEAQAVAGRGDSNAQVVIAAASASRFAALVVLRAVARYLAEHEPRPE